MCIRDSTWFMSQKTFDGKKPYSFLKSQITYALRPKITYAGKAVKLDKQILHEKITAVRSVNYVPCLLYTSRTIMLAEHSETTSGKIMEYHQLYAES